MKHTESGLVRKISDIELRLLRVFKTVVDCGDFSTSEVELNISRSNISNRISDLEDRLGVKLMERGRGRAGFRLTTGGEVIYRAIEELFAHLARFREQVSNVRSSASGSLRIAVPDDVLFIEADFSLRGAISRFQKLAPDVEIEVLAHAVDEVELDLLEDRVDICINAVLQKRSELDSVPLFDHNCYLYCGDQHALHAVPDGELSTEEILSSSLVAAGHTVGQEAAHFFSQFNQKAVANHMSARALLILSGRYIGFLPEYIGKSYEATGAMRRLQPDRFCFHVVNAVLYKKKARQNDLIDLFVSELEREIQTE